MERQVCYCRSFFGNPIKVKKVLLTGAAGYVGHHAVRHLLANDYIVHAVTSKPITERSPRANLIRHQADLLNKKEIENLIGKTQPTHLLHFAWYVEHGKFWNAAENLDWLRASLFLAECFADSGGKRIVAAGTCAEYDWTSEHPFSENSTPRRPQTLYGAAKASLALTLERFAETKSCSFASGKLFFLFGANEQPVRLIPSVTRALLENKPAKTTHGEQIRDFLHVGDAAEAFVKLLESSVCGDVNIASGKGVKLKEIIDTIGEVTGKSELLDTGALDSIENEPPVIVADIKRLRDEVGFVRDFDLRTGLKETIDYWKNNL